jgi:AcrR family transcriptional regulator
MAVASRRVYQVHRDRQRESIVEAAERLFLQYGIEVVSMADIATAAEVTRATLYKYFPNKEEVAWGVFEHYCELSVESERPPPNPALNGYQRVEYIVRSWQQNFMRYPDMMLYFAQFDVLYAKQGAADRMNAFKWSLHHGEEPIVTAIRNGIRDGSLRADLNPELTGVMLHSVFMGLGRRLVVAQPTFQAEFGQTLTQVYEATIQVVLQGLRAEA